MSRTRHMLSSCFFSLFHHMVIFRIAVCQAMGLTNLTKLFPRSVLFKDSFMTYFEHDTVRRVDVISGSFLMFRREALERVGLLDKRFYIYKEDVDWCKRFKEAGMDNVFFPGATIIHYGGASSAATPLRFVLEMVKANF